MKAKRELFVVESSPANTEDWTASEVDVFTSQTSAEYEMADNLRDQEFRQLLKYRVVRYVPEIQP